MNIVFLAAECAPFAKVGGLGDVIGSLPAALARKGHSVKVVVPHHGVIDDTVYGVKPLETFPMMWNKTKTLVEASVAEREGVTHWFLRGWPYFAPDESFIYHNDEGIDIGRFIFFAAAALELCRRVAARQRWHPDVFHAHDWHAAGLSYLLRTNHAGDPAVGGASTLFSIHNMQYQGWGAGWHLARAGLPPVDHPLLAAMGKGDSMLAIGLAYSSALATVSPRYGEEIATPEGGWGLDGLIHARRKNLIGILNGIDVARWNPADSRAIAAPFDCETLSNRRQNKTSLQAELKLQKRASALTIGAVMRLVDQKGPGLLLASVKQHLATTASQFILLGAGDPSYQDAALSLQAEFPGRVAARIGFDEALAERIYAGIDVFLMPSQFEPCGIGQMIAMRYGALPVVNPVGGLADTVDETVGFVMHENSVYGLSTALARAKELHDHDRKAWKARQQNAMRRDFSWERSASDYVRAYDLAIDLRRRWP